MIGFLRFVGLMNAAVWFGAALFFTLAVGPAPFSDAMKTVLTSGGLKNPTHLAYFSGAIAQIFIARYFQFQLVCGIVAVAHLLAEWLYLGRNPHRGKVAVLLALVAAGFLGDFWLQPRLKSLHTIKYDANAKPEQREAAATSFRSWHGVSQGINLLMLGGLGFFLWRTANPADSARFVSTAKFRS